MRIPTPDTYGVEVRHSSCVLNIAGNTGNSGGTGATGSTGATGPQGPVGRFQGSGRIPVPSPFMAAASFFMFALAWSIWPRLAGGGVSIEQCTHSCFDQESNKE